MIFQICLILLPLVLSAVIDPFETSKPNPFRSIIGSGIMKYELIDFLQYKDMIRFVRTCHEYLMFLEMEYESLLEEVPVSSNTSYKDCDNSLKAEIKKLYKYLRIEMSHRKTRDNARFTFPLFFPILDGTFFIHDETRNVIKRDNLRDLKSKFGYKYPTSLHSWIPSFPHISLRLLKTRHDPYEIKSLIKNAAEAPHLFDAFFKYLALNVYRVKRTDLERRIKKDYPNIVYLRHMDDYHSFIRQAFVYEARTAQILWFASITCICAWLGSLTGFDAILSIGMIINLGLYAVLEQIYVEKFERFEGYDAEMLKSYYSHAKKKVFIYFKEDNE